MAAEGAGGRRRGREASGIPRLGREPLGGLQKSLASGADADGLAEDLLAVGLLVADFGTEQASVAAELWVSARRLGLSVADRACLATAVVLGVPALTADRPWSRIEREDLSVELIR